MFFFKHGDFGYLVSVSLIRSFSTSEPSNDSGEFFHVLTHTGKSNFDRLDIRSCSNAVPNGTLVSCPMKVCFGLLSRNNLVA